ncbi:MAG: hypothetical protein JOZ51_09845, partial [Chloroflexi bacterium]|nr:hypothetical protein [Chloroflexota bacterium]
MPLALLLQQTFTALARSARPFNDWIVLVELEDLLLERVRSAFLVHWFGPLLPLEGRTLRVSIANIGALRARYQMLRAGMRPDQPGVNLTEPLAGLAGTFGGILSMPLYGIPLGVVIAVKARGWLVKLLGALNAATLGALFPGLAVLAFPGAIGGALLAGIFAPGQVRPAIDLLGAVAEMMEALRGFVEQLLGPREGVRNPLVRLILQIGDRLAALMAFAIGVIALVFTRIGPLILPLTEQTIALIRLIESVVELIGVIWSDFMTRLEGLFEGEHSLMSPLEPVLRIAGSVGDRVLRELDRLLKALEGALTGWISWAGIRLTDYLGAAKRAVVRAFEGHILTRTLTALGDILRITKAALAVSTPPTPTPPPASSSDDSFLDKVGGWIYRQGPAFPALPDLPDTTVIAGRAGGRPVLGLDAATISELAGMIPTAYSFSPLAYRELEELRRSPPSVFGGELARLREEQGGLRFGAAMTALRQEELPNRALIFAVVERVLPPQAGQYVSQLENIFRTIDEKIYGVRGQSPRPEL